MTRWINQAVYGRFHNIRFAVRHSEKASATGEQKHQGLIRDWDFAPSRRSLPVKMTRLRSALRGWDCPPDWRTILPIEKANRWNILFLFAPDGCLDQVQSDCLQRVSALDGATAVVIASRGSELIPTRVRRVADALYWKALGGYDFSAYAIALEEVVRRSPGATVYLQNDSVIGPLGGTEQLITTMRWRLGGFMASAALENHLQSYALVLRDVDVPLVCALNSVVSTSRALDSWRDVVIMQETRLARVAASRMTVGSLWYDPGANRGAPSVTGVAQRVLRGAPKGPPNSRDPSLVAAADLLDAGFPFVKRSLLSRTSHLHDPNFLRRAMTNRGIDWKALSQ